MVTFTALSMPDRGPAREAPPRAGLDCENRDRAL